MTKLFFNPAVTRTHPGAEIYDRAGAEALREIFASSPGFSPTPLRRLERTARQLGVGQIWAKDERHRWGQGSFKILGGAYAVVSLAAEALAVRPPKFSRGPRRKHRA